MQIKWYFLRSKTINFRPPLQRYVPVAWLPTRQLLYDVIYLTHFLQRTLLKNVTFSPSSMRSCLGKLFRSYYIRLRMCAATASIDRIELHASLTNWMWDSRNRFVSSWQFRCFLGLITSKSATIAFTGAFNANQWRKIKLGSFASIWNKDQSTDLQSERNLRMRRERMEVSLQFAKLAMNVPNAHC